MPVQITPYEGSRLTDVISRGAQINNRREGLRLQDVALKQRGSIAAAQLGQGQARLDLAAKEMGMKREDVERELITQVIKNTIAQNPQASPEQLKQQAAAAYGQAIGDPEGAAQKFADAPMEIFQVSQKLQPFQKGASAIIERDGQQGISTAIFDPNTGEASAKFAPIGGQLVSKLGETGQEQSRRKVDEAGKTAAAKGKADFQQQNIESGLAAADSTAVIRRGLELLDSVQTGGFNAAKLRARQAFGIEAADEGELSSLLGKSVLSQLRETFGAAFTEREGARLEGIEAGFGRSPAANRRLLDNALKLATRAAERGIDAADAAGDTATADDIRSALEFTLGTEESTALPEGVSEEDIEFTMKKHGVTREQVLERLGA